MRSAVKCRAKPSSCKTKSLGPDIEWANKCKSLTWKEYKSSVPGVSEAVRDVPSLIFGDLEHRRRVGRKLNI